MGQVCFLITRGFLNSYYLPSTSLAARDMKKKVCVYYLHSWSDNLAGGADINARITQMGMTTNCIKVSNFQKRKKGNHREQTLGKQL
jgi:hypothetical protein